jgi:hypothetical protein
MLGDDYDSLQEFVVACQERRTELDSSRCLAKLYHIDDLRDIANRENILLNDVQGGGVTRRYSTAEVIADATTSESVGDYLSKYDHEFRHPILTYYRLPDHPSYRSYKKFLKVLKTKKSIRLEEGFAQVFNGITDPPSHRCSIESVKGDKDKGIVSVLFSCTRALVNPSETMADFTNLFLARVPILVRVFFNLDLVEFSVPLFAEPIASSFNYEVQTPKRYQQAFQTVAVQLQNLTDTPLKPIRFSKLPAWFEQEYNAKDMGWKIAPRDEADFDLTQHLIPLKDIVDGFISTLDRECTAIGRSHILEGVDLYHVFRSLQTESHTHTMVQKVPFGQRGGGLVLSVYYGIKNALYYPVILLSNPPTESMLDNLRDAVSKLEAAEIVDRYTINTLLVAEDS